MVLTFLEFLYHSAGNCGVDLVSPLAQAAPAALAKCCAPASRPALFRIVIWGLTSRMSILGKLCDGRITQTAFTKKNANQNNGFLLALIDRRHVAALRADEQLARTADLLLRIGDHFVPL